MGPNLDLSQLSFQNSISIKATIFYIIISGILSLIASWHFRKFGNVFSNREKFSQILPATAMITTLVICVVKASLALSLGLVGALSIVRFRTPIKEPEELIYLFLSIAIGLGTGAGHYTLTIISITTILLILAMKSVWQKNTPFANLYIMISVPHTPNQDEDPGEEILKIFSEKSVKADMRRLESSTEETNLSLQMNCKEVSELFSIKKDLNKKYPMASISYIEQSGLSEV